MHERAYRNCPLSEEQKEKNRERSLLGGHLRALKIRAKVEHVFADWVIRMGGKLVRSIGQARVAANLGLRNSIHNLKRYIFWELKTQS